MRTIGRFLVLATVMALVMQTMMSGPALAHGELIASSPQPDSVVGGEIHGIVLLFSGVDTRVPPDIVLTGPVGAEIEASPLTRDRQQVVLPIAPLSTPGMYTVTWSALSGDGDNSTTSGSFEFEYDPDSPEPEGISIGQAAGQDRFDNFALALLVVGAGLFGFLVHRFWFALRLHGQATSDGADE